MKSRTKERAVMRRAQLDVVQPIVVQGVAQKDNPRTRTLVDVSLMASKFHDPAEAIGQAITEALDPSTVPTTKAVSVDVSTLRGPMDEASRARLRFIRARAHQLCKRASAHGCKPCPLCACSFHPMACAVEDRPTRSGIMRAGTCVSCGGRWERKVSGRGYWFNPGGRVPSAMQPRPDDPPNTIDPQATRRRRMT